MVALVKVFGNSPPVGSVTPEASWLSPAGAGSLTAGLLLCVFAYWGWESSVNLSEESEDPSGAGRAAVVSTVILLGTYVGVAIAIVAYAGPEALTQFDDDDSVLSSPASGVLGSPWDKLVVASVRTAFYYAMTGFACAWFYRAHLRDSLRSLFFVGVGPIVGAIALLYLFVQSLIDLWDPENSYSGAWLGVGPPFVIGVGFMALGVIFMILWRFRGPERYWSRRGERVDPELARATLAGRRR